jgi:hypothetical protein
VVTPPCSATKSVPLLDSRSALCASATGDGIAIGANWPGPGGSRRRRSAAMLGSPTRSTGCTLVRPLSAMATSSDCRIAGPANTTLTSATGSPGRPVRWT